MRILSCIHSSVFNRTEADRSLGRIRRARSSDESDDTVITMTGHLDQSFVSSCDQSTDTDEAMTVALLVNAFAAGLLSGESTRKEYEQSGVAMKLYQCSIPSFEVVIYQGFSDAVRAATASILGTSYTHSHP